MFAVAQCNCGNKRKKEKEHHKKSNTLLIVKESQIEKRTRAEK